ncbi:MAG: DUF218 domain-containing protein [Clostridiales bacterium]|nr:DUF218 domain-containing protein [Clostridiales bacterium]
MKNIRSERLRFFRKKPIIITIVAIVALGLLSASALLFMNIYILSSTDDQIISFEEGEALKADCILVLGAGVRDDGSLSPMLHDRLKQGVALYFAGASDRLLMSGDHGRHDYDEVNAMKTYAVDNGVPSECVFMDHAGFSTYESIYRAKAIFQTKKIIIVTQEYHLPRALHIANAFGLEAYGVSADLRSYGGQTYLFLREIAARGKDFCISILKPKPTYLGDVIPISGDGNITNDHNKDYT